MAERKEYPGINIQWPYSEMILSGKKTIETRTYPIPNKYLGQEMVLIETPGKKGKFKSRMRGIIIFTTCFKYRSETEFYADYDCHLVKENSMWSWDETKGKFGWAVEVVEVFEDLLPLPQKAGIVYCTGIKIPNFRTGTTHSLL